MEQQKPYLCSELVRITAGGHRDIANLEAINPEGCTLTIQERVAVGTQVRMQCLECPEGKRQCTGCVFKGRVRHLEESSPLGCTAQVEFDGCLWSPERWRPRHLTEIEQPTEG